jgi:hypothetical protein
VNTDKIVLLHDDGRTENVSISEVNGFIQNLFCKNKELAAEVERLKEEVENLTHENQENLKGYYDGNSVNHWITKATAYKGVVFAVCEAFRSLGYDGGMGDLSTLPARLETFAATIRGRLTEVETAAQERAAIVAWLLKFDENWKGAYLASLIEIGKHWPTEGKP